MVIVLMISATMTVYEVIYNWEIIGKAFKHNVQKSGCIPYDAYEQL